VSTETELKCPRCGQADLVRQVRDVYYQYDNSTVLATVPSDLVKRIGNETSPEWVQKWRPPTYGEEIPPSRVPLAYIALSIWFLIAIVLAVVFGFVFRNPSMLLCLGGLWIFLAMVLFIDAPESLPAAEQGKRHEKAVPKWNESCYCFRCDVVFIPGGSHVVPAKHRQMRSFFYDWNS
jgi:hypothetical protein